MTIRTIASDYDGTLATHGMVPADTIAALRRWRKSGHDLVMVTGRESVDLVCIFPEYKLFSWVVAENGATLFHCATGEETPLVNPPPAIFVDTLRQRNLGPLYIGRVIIAAAVSLAPSVQEVISELRLPLHIILNKEALMVLPAGVNKAFGLRALLSRLHRSSAEVIGVGDGENDLDLLEMCGFGVAVENAVPDLKQIAGWVTPSPAGQGIIELIDGLLAESVTPQRYAETPSTVLLPERSKRAR